MKFPLRLTADLVSYWLRKKLRKNPCGVVQVLNPSGEIAGLSTRSLKISAKSKPDTSPISAARCSRAPVVWIRDPQPESFPAIGSLAHEVTKAGRFVFLQTDGAFLRRRIHLFRPNSRLFLTLKIYGMESVHDLKAGAEGSFRGSLEGIRTAKLSGFLICVLVPVDTNTNLGDLAALLDFFRTLDVDGFLILPTVSQPRSYAPGSEHLKEKRIEARTLIGNRRWELFSRLIEVELSEAIEAGVYQPAQSVENLAPPARVELNRHDDGVTAQ